MKGPRTNSLLSLLSFAVPTTTSSPADHHDSGTSRSINGGRSPAPHLPPLASHQAHIHNASPMATASGASPPSHDLGRDAAPPSSPASRHTCHRSLKELQDQSKAVFSAGLRGHLHVRVGVHKVRGTTHRHVRGLLYVRLVLCAQPYRERGLAADHIICAK